MRFDTMPSGRSDGETVSPRVNPAEETGTPRRAPRALVEETRFEGPRLLHSIHTSASFLSRIGRHKKDVADTKVAQSLTGSTSPPARASTFVLLSKKVAVSPQIVSSGWFCTVILIWAAACGGVTNRHDGAIVDAGGGPGDILSGNPVDMGIDRPSELEPVCADDGDPCTVETCTNPGDVQHVQTPWTGCRAAVGIGFCTQVLPDAAMPLIERCSVQLRAGFRTIRDTDEIENLWRTFDECMRTAVGCPGTPRRELTREFRVPLFTDDACKQTQMRKCSENIEDAFDRDMAACIVLAAVSRNPEALRLCYIGAVAKQVYGKIQCFYDATCAGEQLCCNEMCESPDATNCGSCGKKDLQTDGQNCGSCGNMCASGRPCIAGVCECSPLPRARCNQACVNLHTDPNNCGACFVACSPTEEGNRECIGGLCRICDDGRDYCRDSNRIAPGTGLHSFCCPPDEHCVEDGQSEKCCPKDSGYCRDDEMSQPRCCPPPNGCVAEVAPVSGLTLRFCRPPKPPQPP
jgi:hypothetical protein